MLSMDEIQQALPGTLDPEDFDPSVYEDSFLKARNINITDADILSGFRKGIDLLKYIIENSFKAATMQGPKTLESRLSDESKGIYAEVKRKLIDFLYQAFSNISLSKNGIPFRQWHDEKCKEMIDIFKGLKNKDGSPAWTYGISQKILNLIIKYLVVITKKAYKLGVSKGSSTIVKAGQVFLDIYPELDIPVDSRILVASWNHNLGHKVKLILPSRDGSVVPAAGIEPWNWRSNKVVKPWTQWNRDDYLKYAESLHKVFAKPLDWEGYAWTEAGR